LSRRNRACYQAQFAAALASGGETAGAVAEGLAVLPALEETVALAQRLSIACALVHDPELLFLDEPTGALDPQAWRNLWDLLRKISAEGRTVVLTTHHTDGAESLCNPVAIMDHGKILKTGPPAALIRELDQPLTPGQLLGPGSGLVLQPDHAEHGVRPLRCPIRADTPPPAQAPRQSVLDELLCLLRVSGQALYRCAPPYRHEKWWRYRP
jgi:putative AbiEii toxin of type IV toxin-antitoxin system